MLWPHNDRWRRLGLAAAADRVIIWIRFGADVCRRAPDRRRKIRLQLCQDADGRTVAVFRWPVRGVRPRSRAAPRRPAERALSDTYNNAWTVSGGDQQKHCLRRLLSLTNVGVRKRKRVNSFKGVTTTTLTAQDFQRANCKHYMRCIVLTAFTGRV